MREKLAVGTELNIITTNAPTETNNIENKLNIKLVIKRYKSYNRKILR